MKKILSMALLAITMTGGVALADRGNHGDRRGGGRSGGHGGVSVRGNVTVNVGSRGHVRGGNRVQRVQRNRVFVSNNRFSFNGGVERRYRRPTFRTRYYDYNIRPQIYAEQMAPVDGYTWVNGTWAWSGNEWVWQTGHYEPVAQYDTGGYYDDSSYSDDGYDTSGYYSAPSTNAPPQGY